MFKIDKEKIKNRINEKREVMGKGRGFSPQESTILKPLKVGQLLFRAVPYRFNDDGDPWVTRSYHFIPRIGQFYCPSLNEAEQCHVCEFVWEQMKKHKGTEKVKEWKNYLPNDYIFLAGQARGREEEGPKFLRIRTYRDNESEKHKKVCDWFLDPETEDWMDPKKGFDIKLKYEENENPRINAKIVLSDIELARKSSLFSKDSSDYEKFVNSVPNIDDILGTKTTDDTLEILRKWQTFSKKQKASEPEQEGGDDLSTFDSPESTSVDDIEKKLSELGAGE